MKYKKSIYLAVFVAVVAALALVEVDPTTSWQVHESAHFSVSKEKLFKFLTDPTKVPEVNFCFNEIYTNVNCCVFSTNFCTDFNALLLGKYLPYILVYKSTRV